LYTRSIIPSANGTRWPFFRDSRLMLISQAEHSPHLSWHCCFHVQGAYPLTVNLRTNQKKKRHDKAPSVKSAEGDDNGLYSVAGYAFLIGSLIFDGLTGPAQEHIQITYHPNFLYVMLHTNIWASIYMFAGTLKAFSPLRPPPFSSNNN